MKITWLLCNRRQMKTLPNLFRRGGAITHHIFCLLFWLVPALLHYVLLGDPFWLQLTQILFNDDVVILLTNITTIFIMIHTLFPITFNDFLS
jgi:hypothetical protein